MKKTDIESKYGVKIVIDYIKGRSNFYKIYSADGCQWENGIRGMIGVEAECKRYSESLLEIKEAVESKS